MRYVLKNANILSGHKDMTAQKKSILVEDGIITAIEDNNFHYDKAKIIDLSGRYLLPGLINMHVHLPGSGKPNGNKKQTKESVDKLMHNKISRFVVYKLCSKYARTELLSGVTTIRTVGGLRDIDSKIRDAAIKDKSLPRILASNMALSVPNGHMAGVLAYEAATKDDATMLVNKIAKTNPDLIKLMITGGVLDAKVKGEPGVLKMSQEIAEEACNTAHKLGFKVAAHVESTEGVRVALKSGVDTIEHGAVLDEETINLFKKNNSAHICTLSPFIPETKFPEEVSHATDFTRYNGEIVFNGVVSCAKTCLQNDIMVGLGTDTACPFVTHYDMWRELVYFVKYVGVTPKYAIYSATLGNAIIAGIEKETGSIDLNKTADFMIVDENPLDNLNTLRKPYMVVHCGKIIKNPKTRKISVIEENLNALDEFK